MKRFKSLQDQCIRWLDQLCQDLPAEGSAGHARQQPVREEQQAHEASALAAPFHVGDVCFLLEQMHMELLGATDILRQCIDEHTGDSCEQNMAQRRGEMQPLSLKERVTKDAVERGIVRPEKSYERKTIARLENDVNQYKEVVQKLQQEAERAKNEAKEAKNEAKEARALAEDRSATSELWRQKAEDCYREKSLAEERWKREREQALREASMRAFDVSIQSLEERLSATEGRLAAEQNEKQRLITEVGVLEEKLLAAEQVQVSVQQLKHELYARSHACAVQVEKLEQEVTDLSLKSRRTVALDALNNANAQAQSYLSNLSRIQEESHLLDVAATQLCDVLDTVATDDNSEGKLQSVSSLDGLSNFMHLNGLASTLGKVHLFVRICVRVLRAYACLEFVALFELMLNIY